ncbi:MAG: glycogen debranching protein GlgX [Thermodesulfobacteriota bacterium]
MQTNLKGWPGTPYPLGAVYDGSGTNFSLFSEIAARVELCLFDEEGNETRLDLPEVTGYCWHGYLPHVEPGQRYGFRVHGPWDPANGQRCNPAKLLLDPYAKAIEGQVQWDEAVFPYSFQDGPDVKNDRDSAPFMPRSVVHQPHFDWSGDRPLQVPWHETILYETHVKGLTATHPDVPPELRGTYAGLAQPVIIEYLKKLGITAVELMPSHYFIHDKYLVDQGLRNYWGYNSIGFFAPHNEYASEKRPGAAVAEFKHMVRTLHQAGLEVILDVVYNHTAEGNHLGPMLCFKGIDNAYYYRVTDDKRYYLDYTGTGNSLNMRNPHVLQLIMDSLRYWILEMHVDGFRFDLAATLARELHDVDRLSAFFDIIQQDPVISQVKLIAEPWDVGEGGYQVGNFPPVWSEWNGKYRDCVRDFWRGEDQLMAEFASRVTGSSDLYENTGRLPYASINFITAHDGFTLNDLVSYNDKHNEANGEDNQDGAGDNRSWNCGAEGPTDDPEVLALRARQQRNFLATLLLSQGVPMLLGGDEIGRTQQGNNNAYCQDNEISWYDWDNIDQDLLAFVQHLVQYRTDHPVLRRRRWFLGRPIHGSEVEDIAWFNLEGEQMSEEDWGQGYAKSLGVFLNGATIPNPHPRSEPVTDDHFYLIFNAHYEPLDFTLPGADWAESWAQELDTAAGWLETPASYKAASRIKVEARSLVVLRQAPA